MEEIENEMNFSETQMGTIKWNQSFSFQHQESKFH